MILVSSTQSSSPPSSSSLMTLPFLSKLSNKRSIRTNIGHLYRKDILPSKIEIDSDNDIRKKWTKKCLETLLRPIAFGLFLLLRPNYD